MPLQLSNLPATTLATTPLADRATPGAFTAQPHSLAERLRWLELDAARILEIPTAFRSEERRWARDMMAASTRAGNAETRR